MLLLALALASTAVAETLTTLKEVQRVLQTTDVRQLLYGSKPAVVLTGTIVEVTPVPGGWYVYRVECPGDGTNAYMLGYDEPCFITWGFDMAVGDTVRVLGELNVLYSSPLVPFIGSPEITKIN